MVRSLPMGLALIEPLNRGTHHGARAQPRAVYPLKESLSGNGASIRNFSTSLHGQRITKKITGPSQRGSSEKENLLKSERSDGVPQGRADQRTPV